MTDSRNRLAYLGLALLLLAWLFLIVASLLFPCIPFPMEQGESASLSRLEHAWVILAHPEWIWEQWTMGTLRIQLADRLPSLVWASLCIAIYTAAGFWICRSCNLLNLPKSRSVPVWPFSFLVGYSCCGTCISLLTWLIPNNYLLTAGLGIAISLGIPVVLNRLVTTTSHIGLENAASWRWDTVSWKRRLTGLFLIGIGILFAMQSIGSLVPSMDEEVKQTRWSSRLATPLAHQGWEQTNLNKPLHWSALEDIRTTWWHELPSSDKNGSMERQVHQLVLSRYELLIASKWIASIAWGASLILLALQLNALHGCLVASLTTFFFAAFPSWTELIRLGRPEVLSAAATVGILCIWMDASRTKSVQPPRNRWIPTIFLMGPIAIGIASSLQFHAEGGHRWTAGILRVSGFSSLYSLPWAATCFLGCIVAVSSRNGAWRWICGSASIAVLAFAILGGWLAQPDRVWIPFSSLLILPFAFGIDRVLQLRGGWGWLVFWVLAGAVSLFNNVAQPGWDNRILGDLKGSIFELPASESFAASSAESRHRFADEIQLKTVEGELPIEGKLFLLGHWDCLDIPQRTVVPKIDEALIATLTRETMRLQGITHIALIDSAEQGFVEWDDSLEHKYRIHLAELEKDGILTKLPVSDRSRDLTLFRVNP